MKKIEKIISYIIMILAIIILIFFYNKYNFNNFDKAIRFNSDTKFTRDSGVKYSKTASYVIENNEYNDAMFSQKIEVKPNTPYKISCMVKTENIQNQNKEVQGGAYICLTDTQNTSNMLTGTNEWQKLTIMFNSKNETQINVGFRLGSYETLSKGKAWFSDFKIESGVASNSNIWKVGCFIFPNIDVNVNINNKNEHVKLQMSRNDISTLKTNLVRFKSSIEEISNKKIVIDYEEYVIDSPIETLSYDDDNGFYVSGTDVSEYIDSYIQENEYDHIYVAFRMADTQKGESVLVNDWIGLGGMEYLGIGFSNIRMPDDTNNLAYEFNPKINTFPEEVFIHEFLHTLERNAKEYGYERPELHDYEKYGYVEENKNGLIKWYTDYMNKSINYNGKNIGLPEEIYTIKPVHNNNFKYTTETKIFEEPNGIIEIIDSIVYRVKKVFKNYSNNIEIYNN